MFSTKTATQLSIQEILDKVNEYDIYSYYMGTFKIGHLYNSPFRKDNNPSFAVYKGRRGNLMFKDHGTGDCGNVIQFVKLMTGYTDSNTIARELTKVMNLSNCRIRKITKTAANVETNIGIVRQPFTEIDKEYWKQFHISIDTLKIFGVFSIQYYLCNNVVKGIYKNESPMYAYKVFDRFKIYRPLATKYTKWRSNLTNYYIQGYEELPTEGGDTLIITKSLKDVMVLYEMGYYSISPSSETTFIPDDILKQLKKKWKHIYILYDRDKTGVTQSRMYSKKYDLRSFFINKRFKAKDISDAVKLNGFVKIKNWLIKELNNGQKE